MTFRHVEKPYETNEKRGFAKGKKALGFSLKVDGVSRLREMLKKHWS